jgi:hypothetical protein
MALHETADQIAAAAQRIEDGIYLIPQHMRGAVRRYFLKGIPPGSFLTAVLSNDLMEALGRADDDNRDALPRYGQFLYNYVPCGSYGSPDAVKAWIASFAEQVSA